MKLRHAALTASLAAGALALSAVAAHADTFYNTLDPTVDATHEVMKLVVPGPDGTTTLKLQIDGRKAGDHPHCNIQGGAHWISLDAISSDATVATVAFAGDDNRFDACSDFVTVVVTPLQAGTTDVTFGQAADSTSNDPHLQWSFHEAAFTVNVADASTGGGSGTVCDEDPAAPAWAAAILQANNYKPKRKSDLSAANLISMVAKRMDQEAAFEGEAKNSHPEYENKVFDYLKTLPGGSGLTKGPADAARPGWVCTPIPLPAL
jgi:hypothetical protein